MVTGLDPTGPRVRSRVVPAMSKDDVPLRDEGLPESHGSGCNLIMLGGLILLIALTIALGRCDRLPRYFSPASDATLSR